SSAPCATLSARARSIRARTPRSSCSRSRRRSCSPTPSTWCSAPPSRSRALAAPWSAASPALSRAEGTSRRGRLTRLDRRGRIEPPTSTERSRRVLEPEGELLRDLLVRPHVPLQHVDGPRRDLRLLPGHARLQRQGGRGRRH